MEVKHRVLILDDNSKEAVKNYIAVLEENYYVESTTNDNELISRVVRMGPDVIIINNDVPEFNGSAMCDLIKVARKTPIILLSENNQNIEVETCKADEIMKIPVNTNLLMLSVQKYMAI